MFYCIVEDVDADRISTILSLRPTMEIDFDGTKFTQVKKQGLTSGPQVLTCTLGEEFEIELPFGKDWQQKHAEKAKVIFNDQKV